MVKKAQTKIQQTAFMLIGIFVFFVLVGLFLVSFRFSSVKDQAQLLEERNALTLVTRLAESPEFSCGEAFGTKKTNCVDSDKLMILINEMDNYENFWGVENIEVRKLDSEEEVLCSSINYPNCNTLRILKSAVSGIDRSNFVTLCRKEVSEGEQYNKCELAKLFVSFDNE